MTRQESLDSDLNMKAVDAALAAGLTPEQAWEEGMKVFWSTPTGKACAARQLSERIKVAYLPGESEMLRKARILATHNGYATPVPRPNLSHVCDVCSDALSVRLICCPKTGEALGTACFTCYEGIRAFTFSGERIIAAAKLFAAAVQGGPTTDANPGRHAADL